MTVKSSGTAARLLRGLRWKEQSERQVWSVAAVNGLISGCSFGVASGRYDGLVLGVVEGAIFGGGCMAVSGLIGRYKLHQRQDAQVASNWANRCSRP